MNTIRDPVHGDIELSDAEIQVLDSPEMQRLRRIKQLSFCSLVYPGANHTRFEHSLGTLYLAGRMAEKLGLEEDEKKKIRMAAMLHDVGHLPFSHSLEGLFGVNHEENSKAVIKRLDALNDTGYNPNEIIKLLDGKGPGKIISSQIDADRMDYLARDSHYTGAAYGVVDTDRIIGVMGMESGELFFNEKGLIALESLLIGRNQMFAAVYFHHTVRIAEAMLQEAMKEIKGLVKVDELLKMGDEEMKLFAKGKSKKAKEMLDLLDSRRLYKLAYTFKGKPKNVDHPVLLSKIVLPKKLAFDMLIKTEKGLKPLSSISDMAKELKASLKALEGQTEVYAPRGLRDEVRVACGKS